jgi:very-short-patch-repair endonuclease
MTDPDTVIARLAASQHRVVTRAQLLDRGLSRRQVDRRIGTGLLVSRYRGVFLVGGGEPTYEALVLTACWATGGLASHRSAAALFGLRRVPRTHVEVVVEGRPSRLAGVSVHRSAPLAAIDRSRIGIIPVTAPGLTLLHLAVVAPDLVEGALDDALVRRLTSIDALERLLERAGRGRAGTAQLRRLVRVRRAGQRPTESALEDDFVALLRDCRLPVPVGQEPVTLAGGKDARFDFVDAGPRIDFEVDGDGSHAGYLDRLSDAYRDTAAGKAGWFVQRFTTEDIRERPLEVVATVRALRLIGSGQAAEARVRSGDTGLSPGPEREAAERASVRRPRTARERNDHDR